MTRYALFSTALLTASLLLTLCPLPAAAWGPGVHMVSGNWLLQNLSFLPAAVAVVLMRHPGQFLHGLLSPDIFIGKGSKAKTEHSHHWSSGFALLRKASAPAGLAYAYGYLSHLAADTVAHNLFVPGLTHTLPGCGRTAHVYLEAQADRLLDWDSADALAVFREQDSQEGFAMLRDTMRQNRLLFTLKTGIFRSSIALGGSRLWKNSMRLADVVVPAHTGTPLVADMLRLSTRAMYNVLLTGENSPLLSLDPIGAEALQDAATAAQKSRTPASAVLPGSLVTPLFGSIAGATPPAARLCAPVPPVLASLAPVCTNKEFVADDPVHPETD